MNDTILIVDDEPHIIRSIRRMLMEERFRMLSAGSGDDALDIMQDQAVDLVISDHKMPGMSGVELLSIIHAEYPDTLTILMTAHADIPTAVAAVNEAGIYKFILKPWDEETFHSTICRAMHLKGKLARRTSVTHQVGLRDAMLEKLEREYPGITRVDKDERGYVMFS